MPPPNGSNRPQPATRVLIVDDRTALAEGLATALAARGLAATALTEPLLDGAVPSLAGPQCSVALVSLDLAEPGAPDALTRALADAGWIVIALATHGDPLRLAACIEAGAAGWVAATASLDHLAESVIRLAAGTAINDPDERFTLLRDLRSSRDRAARKIEPFNCLTPREREVLASLAAGLTLAEIAEVDYVSPVTVRNQIQSILTKLSTRSRVEAVAMAHSSGWLAARRSA